MNPRELATLALLFIAIGIEWPLVLHLRPNLVLFFVLPIVKCGGFCLSALVVVFANWINPRLNSPSRMFWLVALALLASSIAMDVYFLNWVAS